MLRKFFATLFVIANIAGGQVFSSSNFAEPEPPAAKIIHVPVASLRENEMLVVEARVDGSSERVAFMRLYFKSKNQSSYDYVEMSQGGAGFYAELPANRFSPPELNYFILALLNDRNVVTYPEWNPYGNPLLVSIASGGRATTPVPTSKPPVSTPLPSVTPSDQPEVETLSPKSEQSTSFADLGDEGPILILSPEVDEQFNVGEEVIIGVSFFSTDAEVDPASINLFVDGDNVTLKAEITENLLTYTAKNLQPGIHQVLVQGYYASGAELPATTMNFKVVGQERRDPTLSNFSARVFAETRQEKISGGKFSDNNIGGQLNGRYGVVKYDANVFLTSREDSHFQPRHRYSLNLDIPILGVTLGDTYPRFNDLMLWGKRVRGVWGRLHTGVFNVDVVYGETNRRVKPAFSLVLDPITGTPLQNSTGQDSTVLSTFGNFRQSLFGLRQSWGSGRNFQLGFNLLKVRDKFSSADSVLFSARQISIPPQDNVVVGSDFLLAFDNHRIELTAVGAFSLFSNDISTGPLDKQDIEDQFDVNLPFNPADFKDWLIINASTTPLDPRDLTSLAYNVNLRLNYFNNDFRFGYKSIGGEYQSLGNSFLRNNIRGFFVDDRLRVYQNKIYLNFGFENYKDNFDADNQNPRTDLQTLSAGFSIYPDPRYPNLTFSLRNHNRDNDVTSVSFDSTFTPNLTQPTGFDTTFTFADFREKNKTMDWSIQASYDLNFMQLKHSVSVNYIASGRNDGFSDVFRLQPLGKDTVNLRETSSNVQLFSVRTQYQIPLTTTFNFIRNENKFASGLNNFKFNMFGGNAEYLWLNQKLRTYFGINLTTASGVTTLDTTRQTITDYTRLGFTLGARFDITPGQVVSIDGQLIKFNDDGGTFDTVLSTFTPTNPSFTDRIFRLYYEKRF